MNTNVMNAYKQEPSVNSEPTQIPVTGSGKTSATSFVSQFDTSAASKKETAHKVKICTDDVHVYYGETEAIKGIDLEIYENEVIAFIGPSGCGKSTFCVL